MIVCLNNPHISEMITKYTNHLQENNSAPLKRGGQKGALEIFWPPSRKTQRVGGLGG